MVFSRINLKTGYPHKGLKVGFERAACRHQQGSNAKSCEPIPLAIIKLCHNVNATICMPC